MKNNWNPYVMLAPDWSNVSGGGALLHSWAVRMHKLGAEIYINTKIQNPLWEPIPTMEMYKGNLKNVIAIYPEVTHGNPFKCGHVARLLLHLPGFHGGPAKFDNGDMLFTHSNIFNSRIKLPQDRVVPIPYINTKMFVDKNMKRTKTLAFIGKGAGHYPHAELKNIELLGTGFDFNGKAGQEKLTDILNQTKILYCYDNITAMVEIARLCGCPVVIVPDPQWTAKEIKKYETWDCGGIGYGLEEQQHALDTIDAQRIKGYYENEFEYNSYAGLKRFIHITQASTGGYGVEDGIVEFTTKRAINFQGKSYGVGKKYEMSRKKFYSAWFTKGLMSAGELTVLKDEAKYSGKNKPMQWPLRGENKHLISNTPAISVCCLTYNHENVIKDALDGFVMQRTKVPFEIVICDDASTDKTPAIIQEYADKYPGLIRPFLLKENQYSKTNKLPFANHLFPNARGKYIAECDGDDYWTDCFKLQKQYDYMISHRDCSLSYHDLTIYYTDTDNAVPAYSGRPKDYTPEELSRFEVFGLWLHPSTKMWCNVFNKNTKKDFEICSGDNATNVLLSLYGGCGFVEGIGPSVFRRRHGNNMWSDMGRDETLKKTRELFKTLYDFMKTKNREYAKGRYEILRRLY